MKTNLTIIVLFLAAATCFAADKQSIGFYRVSNDVTSKTKQVTYDNRGETIAILIEVTPIVSEADIAYIEQVPPSPTAIKIVLTDAGQEKLEDGVKDMKGRQLAIAINDKVVAAPVLQQTSMGKVIILDGNLRPDEVNQITATFKNENG